MRGVCCYTDLSMICNEIVLTNDFVRIVQEIANVQITYHLIHMLYLTKDVDL